MLRAASYSDPDANSDVLARVQKHTNDILEIIQSSDDVAFVADSTNLVVPPNAFFHTVEMDFMRPINVQWIKVVGLQFAMQSNVQVRAEIKYRPNLDLTSKDRDQAED